MKVDIEIILLWNVDIPDILPQTSLANYTRVGAAKCQQLWMYGVPGLWPSHAAWEDDLALAWQQVELLLTGGRGEETKEKNGGRDCLVLTTPVVQ